MEKRGRQPIAALPGHADPLVTIRVLAAAREAI